MAFMPQSPDSSEPARAPAIVLIGPAGSGKSTVGALLAQTLGREFLEGDRFHSPMNVEKMERGEPLTDEDRVPWLQRLQHEIGSRLALGRDLVVTCSCLKRSYRDIVAGGHDPRIRFVLLRVTTEGLRTRLSERRGHFAGLELLDSQLASLEPAPDVIGIDGELPPTAQVSSIIAALGLARHR